jgi:hypothetical protein
MFERIKTRQINNKIELQEAELRQSLLGKAGDITEGNNYILPEADEGDWKLIGSNTEKGLDTEKQEILREEAIKTYFKSTHGRNIIRLFEKYVVGHGFNIEPISGVPAVKEVWKAFWKENKMALRKKEIVRRTMRDGEAFLRYFEDEKSVKVRFMNPSLVADPEDKREIEGNIYDGIETDSDDIETVLNYYYKGNPIFADEIQHLKIMVDSDVPRGRSYYEPLLPLLAMYKKWMMDRMKLNEIRNTVALIKKVKGTPTQTANVATKYPTYQKQNPDGTLLHKAPKNVSVYTTNQNVDYDLKSPNLQASDVQHDGRALLLSIAAGAGLPEFMVTSDSSNSNYASTMTAEGPAVMEFEDWQDFFAEAFKGMFERVIKHAIKNNKVPDFETITEKEIQPDGTEKETTKKQPTSTECSITFPDLVSRDIEKETKAYILQSNQGWLSDVTASANLDLNYEDEQRMIGQQDEDTNAEKDEEDLEIEKQKKEMEDEE